MKKHLISIFSIALSLQLFAQGFPYNPEYVFDKDTLAKFEANLPLKAEVKPQKSRKVLVFSKTTSFRHYEGIAAGKFFVENTGIKTGAWETVISDDVSNFEKDKISQFDCIVMNNTTGSPFSEHDKVLEKMSEAEKNAVIARDKRLRDNLIEYVKNGGGLFGIHSATDTYRIGGKDRYEPYLEMIGGAFISHPWGSNETSVIVIEDRSSPITKGVWEYNTYMNDEIYMMDSQPYDRSKLRVLASLNLAKSPSAYKSAMRSDRDIPVIWIKNFGKGRVAYGSLGHSQKPYLSHKEVPLMYMRLLQFACGDLPCDVTSLPQPTGDFVNPKVFDMPTIESVKTFENFQYGENAAKMDEVVFAFYDFNDVETFTKPMAEKLLDILAANKGTSRYRSFVAVLIDAMGAKDAAVKAKLDKQIASEKDESVKSRLIATSKRALGEKQFLNKPSAYAVPASLPASDKEIMRAIVYVGRNPDAKIPAWLDFANLSTDALKSAFVYSLCGRNEGMDKIRTLVPASAELAIAYTFAAAKMGGVNDITKIITFADLLDKDTKPVLLVHLLGIKGAGRVEKLADELKNTNAARSSLAADAIAQLDISAMAKKLLKDFDTSNADQKQAIIKILESISTPEIFVGMLDKLPLETDDGVKNSICRSLVRGAQNGVDEVMIKAVANAYPQLKSLADKKFLLRFTPTSSSADALEICKKACQDGLAMDVARYLAGWKNSNAKDLLIKIASSGKDAEKSAAKDSIMQVLKANELNLDLFTFAYKSAKPESKAELIKLAEEKPSMEVAKFLESVGEKALAEKIILAIKNSKPKFLASDGIDPKNLERALDGNIKTRWASNRAVEPFMWVMLDMAYPQTIKTLVFDSGSSVKDYPAKLDVLAGNSLEQLQPADAEVKFVGNAVNIYFKSASPVRYVKLVSRDSSGRWWSIHEITID